MMISASRAVARRGTEEIAPRRRSFLLWAAGGIAPMLAFLLIASRLYETCAVLSGGRLDCRSQSLGQEGLVLGLVGVAVIALVAITTLLLLEEPSRKGTLSGRWPAALPAAAALAGLVGLTSPLAVIGILALGLVTISVMLFFLPTETREEAQGRS